MYYYRKNVGGLWETKRISPDESKKIQESLAKMSLKTYQNIKNLAKASNIEISEQCIAVILEKVVPTYDSLANDMVEEAISSVNAPRK